MRTYVEGLEMATLGLCRKCGHGEDFDGPYWDQDEHVNVGLEPRQYLRWTCKRCLWSFESECKDA